MCIYRILQSIRTYVEIHTLFYSVLIRSNAERMKFLKNT